MSENPQVTVWNEDVGSAWVTYADHFDATLEHFGEAALAALNVHSGERVVDIGCGAGATTLRLAAAAAPAAVLGVDLSKPMLGLARQRATAAGLTNVTFAEHDVEAEPFGSGVVDAAYSRFGVMFFEQPVRAFTHVHESLVPSGRLGFVCFQSPFDNPFILVPTMAAAPILKMSPPTSPTAPSPFASGNGAHHRDSDERGLRVCRDRTWPHIRPTWRSRRPPGDGAALAGTEPDDGSTLRGGDVRGSGRGCRGDGRCPRTACRGRHGDLGGGHVGCHRDCGMTLRVASTG